MSMSSKIKNVSAFMSASILAQGVSALTGLALAQWLTIEEYATYTIMIMSIGSMMLLTQGGVHLGLNSILGAVWPNTKSASDGLASALYVRKKIALYTCPLVITLAVYLLVKNDNNIYTIFYMVIFLYLLFLIDYKTRLHIQFLLFANKASKIQIMDGYLAIVRFSFIAFFNFFGFLSTTTAVLSGLLVAFLRLFRINVISRKTIQHPGKVNNSDVKKIQDITKRQFPLDVLTALQAQAVLIIIASYGINENTAAFGALTRIGQLFLPITALITAYAIPKICQTASYNLGKNIFFWCSFVGLFCIVLINVSVFLPGILLYLVGDNYSQYYRELVVSSVYASFNAIVFCFWTLLANRGLNKYTYTQYITFPLWCGMAFWMVDMSTLYGALLFQFGAPLSLLIAASLDFINKNKVL